MKKILPNVSFVEGLCISVMVPISINANEKKEEKHFYIIGYLNKNIPFMLCYIGAGLTQWYCEENLGNSLRRKVLEHFKTEIKAKDVFPSYMTLYDFKEDLPSLHKIAMDFIEKIWEQKYLGKEALIILSVPSEEKEEVESLGGFWDRKYKSCCIEESKKEQFSRWIK